MLVEFVLVKVPQIIKREKIVEVPKIQYKEVSVKITEFMETRN